jgi:hypothetical protein
MELVNNTVWVVSGHDCFAILSSKAYAEEYRESLIKIWEESIIRDSIPRRLNNRSEIIQHAGEYPPVVFVDRDHYELVKGWKSGPEGTAEHWRYDLFSNKDWEEYYEHYISGFVIEDYLILK